MCQDNTAIMIDKKRIYLRFNGDEKIAYYTAINKRMKKES